MFLVNGVGITIVGIAIAIGRNAFTLAILLLGSATIVAGLALYMIHPRWAEPRWMRTGED